MTRYAGLIGYPLRHSISAAFHQAAFDHLGLEARYELWETEEAKLPARLSSLRQPSHMGSNVTIPYKEAVISHLDELDGLAQRIGAVNTIVNREGRLTGHNTDAAGFLRSLREEGRFDPRGKQAVVLGAGGAARAVVFALASAGAASVTIANRTQERARDLAWELKSWDSEIAAIPWRSSDMARAIRECDLLVNCTSVGMKDGPAEGESPVRADLISAHSLVYDLVYNPPQTPLLTQAREAGGRGVGGLLMLVYQGAASFELWTGKPPPIDIMVAAGRRALEID